MLNGYNVFFFRINRIHSIINEGVKPVKNPFWLITGEALMKITLSPKYMEDSFLKYLNEIFCHPEITCAKVKNIIIDRGSVQDSGRKAFEEGYHDCYSDIDLSVKVSLPSSGRITPEEYMKRIDNEFCDVNLWALTVK
jgi:hypothetical protein